MGTKVASKSSLVVSQRGQVTLPADARRRLGIKEGGVVTLEERRGELILRPAAVLELETYSDEEIDRWNKEDRFSLGEKARLHKKLSRKR